MLNDPGTEKVVKLANGEVPAFVSVPLVFMLIEPTPVCNVPLSQVLVPDSIDKAALEPFKKVYTTPVALFTVTIVLVEFAV
jgi:hypothetical protein